MVKIKKAAKTGGQSRFKRQRVPRESDTTYSTRSPNATYALGVDKDIELFSLRDVARHTDSHRSDQRSSNSRLREQTIHFVRSSDHLKGTRHHREENSHSKDTNHQTFDKHDNSVTSVPEAALNDRSSARIVSPTPSASSDEVVLFTGRKNILHWPNATQQPSEVLSSALIPDLSQETHTQKNTYGPGLPDHLTRVRNRDVIDSDNSDHGRSRNDTHVTGMSKEENSSSVPSPRNYGESQSYSDDSLVDYLQNMQAHGELDDDFVMQAHGRKQDFDVWDAQDLKDFDEISTSEDAGYVIEHILARRQRLSGLQYLVVWQDQSIDEARWIHHQAPSMRAATNLLRKFEEQVQYAADSASNKSSSSSGDGDNDEREDEDDENTFLSQAETDDDGNHDDDASLFEDEVMGRMADEQIARLLSKQEELGMGSDELILFDDPGLDTDDLEWAEKPPLLRDPQGKKKNKGKTRKEKGRHLHPVFDSQNSLPGEDYGSFDIMDFERASISRGAKDKQEPWFGLSDPDLEAELRAQFAADREKKQAKKQEREELRAQGLLGKRNKFKPDLNARYHDGLGISQLKHELEDFLFNDTNTLALPPMGKSERKIVHEIASQFNLKSKSIGSGKSRFPMLYKTSRTTAFDIRVFIRAEKKLGGRSLPRLERQSKGRGLTSRRSGGGGVTSGTGYAEGETVGASAPELGSDNRGRAMLEKMGWSTGMALGALDNKGILQPITHIVKKTRAGLG